MSERCPICDRPRFHCGYRGFKNADADAAQLRGECTSSHGIMGPAPCDNNRVDWRARALAAEAKLAEMKGET